MDTAGNGHVQQKETTALDKAKDGRNVSNRVWPPPSNSTGSVVQRGTISLFGIGRFSFRCATVMYRLVVVDMHQLITNILCFREDWADVYTLSSLTVYQASDHI